MTSFPYSAPPNEHKRLSFNEASSMGQSEQPGGRQFWDGLMRGAPERSKLQRGFREDWKQETGRTV